MAHQQSDTMDTISEHQFFKQTPWNDELQIDQDH